MEVSINLKATGRRVGGTEAEGGQDRTYRRLTRRSRTVRSLNSTSFLAQWNFGTLEEKSGLSGTFDSRTGASGKSPVALPRGAGEEVLSLRQPALTGGGG
jgi:hypothetical protein